MSSSVSKSVSRPRRPRRRRATSTAKSSASRRKQAAGAKPAPDTPSAQLIPVQQLALQLQVTADQIWADIRAGRRLAKEVAGIVCVECTSSAGTAEQASEAASSAPPPAADPIAPEATSSAAKPVPKIIGASAHCTDTSFSQNPTPPPLAAAVDPPELIESLRQQQKQLQSMQSQLNSLAESSSLQQLTTLLTQSSAAMQAQLQQLIQPMFDQLTTTLTELTTAMTKLEHTSTTTYENIHAAITELSGAVKALTAKQEAAQSAAVATATTTTELAECRQVIVTQNQRIEDLEVLNKALLDNHEL